MASGRMKVLVAEEGPPLCFLCVIPARQACLKNSFCLLKSFAIIGDSHYKCYVIHENGSKEKKTENRVKPSVAREPTPGGSRVRAPENFEIFIPLDERKSCFQQRKLTKIRFSDFEILKKKLNFVLKLKVSHLCRNLRK